MSVTKPKTASSLPLSVDGNLIPSRIDNDVAQLDRTWYRGDDAAYYPEKVHLLDERSAIQHIVGGALPEAPLVNGATKVTAFGSCFAVHISDWLANTNYNILTARMVEAACTRRMCHSFFQAQHQRPITCRPMSV
jgi:DUF1680 family protein